MSKFTLNKGLIIAGTQSSSGKTAVAAMLLAELRQRGIVVQPFKVGPDFIDPGYHRTYAGTDSVNLDAWIMGEAEVRRVAERFTRNGFGIVEGVMGLFDGANPDDDEGSTFEIACWLGWPILLVVPCAGAGRSLVASIGGFLHKAGPERVAGMILNQVSSEDHTAYLRKACAKLTVPLLGVVPKLPELDWPERHLGLQASTEGKLPPPGRLAEIAETCLDVDWILEHMVSPEQKKNAVPENRKKENPLSFSKRIGVALDAAFHFYYRANLEWLREKGVEVVPFSPLDDSALPENLDGLVLGGGFPEVFAERVSRNFSMRESLKQVIESGMPCYAECGGLMLLSEQLETKEGLCFPMVGALPGGVKMGAKLQNFGYCLALQEDGTTFRGHEFHHSCWKEEKQRANAWTVRRHANGSERREGFRNKTLHASYVHLYFPQAGSLLKSLFGV